MYHIDIALQCMLAPGAVRASAEQQVLQLQARSLWDYEGPCGSQEVTGAEKFCCIKKLAATNRESA